MKRVTVEQNTKLTQKESAELVKKGQMTKAEFESKYVGKFKNHIRKLKGLFNKQSKTGSFTTGQVDRDLSAKMSANNPEEVIRQFRNKTI